MALKSGSSFPNRLPAGWRPIWFGALAAVLLTAASPAPAEDAQQAVDSAVESDQIQRDRARDSLEKIEKQPDIQHNPPVPRPEEPPSRLWLNLAWLPYIILAVIAVALVFVLARYAGQRYAARNTAAAKAAAPVATSSVLASPEPERDRTFDEVDALAESGAFTEAVHRLLLLVQERLRSRIEHGIQASLTSREILRRARLSQEGSTAFATLVAAVEISLFGMRDANAATYALCREHSRRVLAAAAEASA
ncbi:DUF4129 domain-containing protein [Dongia sp.]|uniref:DUF4129 domain-containing protein n=1 Tax=Dongia sp. TaxID=1977262 RepID=UPI00375038CB